MSVQTDLSIESQINGYIKDYKADTNLISDGYHTFGELYEHRITLWIALCRLISNKFVTNIPVWRTLLHSDGSKFEGWFVLGVGVFSGEQMTYHLPISKWDECDFANTFDKAPEWDGHTSKQVLERISKLL